MSIVFNISQNRKKLKDTSDDRQHVQPVRPSNPCNASPRGAIGVGLSLDREGRLKVMGLHLNHFIFIKIYLIMNRPKNSNKNSRFWRFKGNPF